MRPSTPARKAVLGGQSDPYPSRKATRSRATCSASSGSASQTRLGISGGLRLDHRDQVPGLDRLALLGGERLDRAGFVGGDLVLHLHRLDDADEVALLDGLALLG